MRRESVSLFIVLTNRGIFNKTWKRQLVRKIINAVLLSRKNLLFGIFTGLPFWGEGERNKERGREEGREGEREKVREKEWDKSQRFDDVV